MSEKEKPKNIKELLQIVEKKFARTNPDIVFDPTRKYEAISSGNLAYDLVSGVGGYPRRRITEIISWESMGKTSLLLAGMAKAQKEGLISVLFDFEQSFNHEYAEWTYGLKVDDETFIVFQPENIEHGDELFDLLVNMKQKVDLVCFDSIESMKPKAIVEGSLKDATPIGLHARAMGQFTHKLKNAANHGNFAAVYTNQIRAQITSNQFVQSTGIAMGHTYKDPYTTPGGNGPRFLSSIRMKLDYGGKDEDMNATNMITGETEASKNTKKIKIVNVKNKCATPELKFVTHFDYPILHVKKGGWNTGKDVLEIMKRRGRIFKEKSTYHYKGLSIPDWTVVGQQAFDIAFAETPEIVGDALQLLEVLRKEEGNPALFVDHAVLGEDITKADQKGQESETITLSGLDEKITEISL